MFSFKKKEKMNDLPDLTPSAPTMRDYQRVRLPPIEPLSEEKEEIHSLPSFPDSPMSKGFSQSAIKSAVGDSEHENSDEMNEWKPEPKDTSSTPKNPRTIEMDEWSPQAMPILREEMRLPPPPMRMSQSADSKRPLFVKLDKFREARDSLAKISEKLDQMDELLKMIRDIKAKEDEEINSWERDMENIKARISLVNKEIFENAY